MHAIRPRPPPRAARSGARPTAARATSYCWNPRQPGLRHPPPAHLLEPHDLHRLVDASHGLPVLVVGDLYLLGLLLNLHLSILQLSP